MRDSFTMRVYELSSHDRITASRASALCDITTNSRI